MNSESQVNKQILRLYSLPPENKVTDPEPEIKSIQGLILDQHDTIIQPI